MGIRNLLSRQIGLHVGWAPRLGSAEAGANARFQGETSASPGSAQVPDRISIGPRGARWRTGHAPGQRLASRGPRRAPTAVTRQPRCGPCSSEVILERPRRISRRLQCQPRCARYSDTNAERTTPWGQLQLQHGHKHTAVGLEDGVTRVPCISSRLLPGGRSSRPSDTARPAGVPDWWRIRAHAYAPRPSLAGGFGGDWTAMLCTLSLLHPPLCTTIDAVVCARLGPLGPCMPVNRGLQPQRPHPETAQASCQASVANGRGAMVKACSAEGSEGRSREGTALAGVLWDGSARATAVQGQRQRVRVSSSAGWQCCVAGWMGPPGCFYLAAPGAEVATWRHGAAVRQPPNATRRQPARQELRADANPLGRVGTFQDQVHGACPA